MANWNIPSLFSTCVHSAQDCMTLWLTWPARVQTVYSWIWHLLFAAYWENSSVMSKFALVWNTFTFDIFAFSLSSAYQSLSRCHAEEEDEKQQTANLL